MLFQADLRCILAIASSVEHHSRWNIRGFRGAVESGADGDLYSVEFDVKAANQKLAPKQRIVLRKSIHGHLNPSAGDECRLIDGRVGVDGRIRADISTVVVRTAALPKVVIGAPGTAQVL